MDRRDDPLPPFLYWSLVFSPCSPTILIMRIIIRLARRHIRRGRKMSKSEEERYKELYKAGTTPWDIGRPDFNLIDTVTQRRIQKCNALDIGCGSGTNSLWLAQKGFTVTGVDVSEIALQNARENASKAGVDCTFLLADFLKQNITGMPFGFVFDRGCFHSFDSDEVRKAFSERVAVHLEEGGLWLSIIGNADGLPHGATPQAGPPRRSAGDIAIAVEGTFEILSLHSSHFESNSPQPPRAWVCLMRKR
jgi:SAM-dependent methyltransferase